MISKDSVRTVVGIIGNIISFSQFLSPLPTFKTIIGRKAVEHFSPAPYLATLLNSMMWVVYGLPIVHPNYVLVLCINSIGCLIMPFYIFTFVVFSPHSLRVLILEILVAELVMVGVILAGVLCRVHNQEKRTEIVGILCAILGTTKYLSLLSDMKTVIQTKSVKYMPFSLTFVNFLNALCWMTYSVLRFDLYLLIPNGLGALLCTVMLITYFIYYRATHKDEPKQYLQLSQVRTSDDV